MTKCTINQEPLYSCCGCADYVSLHADMLRIFDDSLWCEECWDPSVNGATVEYDTLQGFDEFLKGWFCRWCVLR